MHGSQPCFGSPLRRFVTRTNGPPEMTRRWLSVRRPLPAGASKNGPTHRAKQLFASGSDLLVSQPGARRVGDCGGVPGDQRGRRREPVPKQSRRRLDSEFVAAKPVGPMVIVLVIADVRRGALPKSIFRQVVWVGLRVSFSPGRDTSRAATLCALPVGAGIGGNRLPQDTR